MSAHPAPNGAATPDPDRFAWHPRYRGRSLAEVQAEIERELASDQRAYTLALEGAERHENSALASVIELERKWGPYDLDWAETDPAALAERVAAFEQARERRQEMVPYAAYRDEFAPAPATASGRSGVGDRPSLPVGGRPPLLWVVVAVALVLLLVLFFVT
jgi:hypothetical protein